MVEVPPPPATAYWQTSSASSSAGEECVQVTCDHRHVWVRDSKNSRGPVLGFTGDVWTAFLRGVQRDEVTASGHG